MKWVLPDCRAIVPRRGLSPRQEREIVRVLAQDGPEGLEAWLRSEEERDPTIRERVAALRARLDRDVRARKRELQRNQAEEKEGARAGWEKRMAEMAEREEALQARLAKAKGPIQLTQEEVLARTRLVGRTTASQAARPTLGRRFRSALRRLWIVIVSLWVRLVRAVTGRAAKEPKTVLVLPEGATIDATALGPDAVMGLARVESSWRSRFMDRLLGREDYAEAAKRRLQEQAAAAAKELQQQRKEETRRAQHELEEVKKQERIAQRQRRQEEEALLEKQRQESKDLEVELDAAPYEELRQELLSDLHEAGLVDPAGHVTRGLVERFSSLLYEEARRTVPGTGEAAPGTYVEGEGEYEVGPLRSLHEIGAIDLAQSVLQSRIRHPHVRHLFDEDVRVHREVRTERSHLVLVFDASGSMEEQGRLEAAKRICLVLWRAVKERNPEHRVDLLRMETHVEPVDLAACWNTEPGGFTNQGAALRKAARLFEAEGADRKTLYLVTDGLPEAWTDRDGIDHADRVDVCMPYALRQAEALRRIPDLHTVILQLETEDPLFLEAAKQLAEAAGGRVEALDPQDLLKWMMTDYDQHAVATAQ